MPKGKRPPFIQIDTSFFLSLQDKKLEHVDLWVIMLLKSRHNSFNNGNISLGLKEVVRDCACSKAAAVRSFQRLQDARLIEKTYQGHMSTERKPIPSKWRLLFVSDYQLSEQVHKGTQPNGSISEPMNGSISEPNGVGPFGNLSIDLDLYHDEGRGEE